MWSYRSRLQPRVFRREAVTAAFSQSRNMKDSSLSSRVMCVILCDVFIQLSFSNVTEISPTTTTTTSKNIPANYRLKGHDVLENLEGWIQTSFRSSEVT